MIGVFVHLPGEVSKALIVFSSCHSITPINLLWRKMMILISIFSLTYSLELLKVCITGHIYHVSIPHRSSCILTVQQFFFNWIYNGIFFNKDTVKKYYSNHTMNSLGLYVEIYSTFNRQSLACGWLPIKQLIIKKKWINYPVGMYSRVTGNAIPWNWTLTKKLPIAFIS